MMVLLLVVVLVRKMVIVMVMVMLMVLGGDGGLIQIIIWHLKVWEDKSCINEQICNSGHIGTFPSDGRNSKVLQPPPPPGGEVDLEELPLLQIWMEGRHPLEGQIFQCCFANKV